MNTIIPAGYRISCTTWENDADNYQTNCVEGLTKEQAHLTMDLVLLLEVHGNMYEPSESEVAKLTADIKKVLIKHTGHADLEGVDLEDDDDVLDFFHEYTSDLAGNSEHYYTRVLSSFRVNYIPQQIEMLDVTKEFGV